MPKALITGASSGIGEEIARILSDMGYETVLVARREERLIKLSSSLKTKSYVCALDLRDMESVKKLPLLYPDIDILVNNAGFGVFGDFCDTDFEKESAMIDVNIRALHYLMKAYLSIMKERGGKILNVASIAAFFSGPLLSSYYATKAYVLRLSNAVREELRLEKAPVTVTVLCPGPVSTEFDSVAGSDLGKAAVSKEYVARLAVKGLMKGKSLVLPSFIMKCAFILSKLCPAKISVRILYHIQKAKKN